MPIPLQFINMQRYAAKLLNCEEPNMEKIKKTDDEWKKELTDEQFRGRAQEGHRARVHRRILG